jgi:nucleoid-associated protein YgaU
MRRCDEDFSLAADRAGLALLVAAMAALAGALLMISGPPDPSRLPPLPSLTELERLLYRQPGSTSLGGVLAWTIAAAWLLVAWITASLVVEAALAVAERGPARGAAWVRGARAVANRLAFPAATRLVGAVVTAQLTLLRPLPLTTASAAEVVVAGPTSRSVDQVSTSMQTGPGPRLTDDARWWNQSEDAAPPEAPMRKWVVRRGDTLWSIAAACYGDGEQFGRVIEANVGRVMPSGRTFDRGGLIRPGDVLIVPPDDHDGGDGPQAGGPDGSGSDDDVIYVVRPGDSLWGVADHELGDPTRWPEIFERNRGARTNDGHVLTNPNLIWPRETLDLGPRSAPPVEPADAVQVPAAPAPPPVEEPPAPAPTPAMPSLPRSEPAPTPTLVAPVVVAMTAPPAETMPAPAAPTVEAPAVAPAPGLLWPPPDWAAPVVGAVAGAALLVAAAAARRRNIGPARRESDTTVRGGFAEGAGDEVAVYEEGARRLGEQVLAVARARGCGSLQLQGTYAGRNGATLLLHVDPTEAQALADLARSFDPTERTIRLSGPDRYATATQGPGDYQWEQAWSKPRPHLLPGTSRPAPVELLPLGLAFDRRILYAERGGLGHVLVAGQDAAAVHTVQASLVMDLARRQPPSALQLLTIARPDRLEPLLAELPQQQLGFVDPADVAAVADVFARVDQELDQRLAAEQTAAWPDLVLAVDEWADLEEPGAVLDRLARHGPGVGIRLLAATSQVTSESLPHWVGLFRTRLVLEVPDVPSSLVLLGEEGAEDLDRGGELWPYLGGRIMPRIRGFRVPPGHVQQLLAQMRARLTAEQGILTGAAAALAHVESPNGPVGPEAAASGGTAEGAEDGGRQLPLIRVVALPEHEGAPASPRLHIQVLGGHAALVDGEPVPEPRNRRPWEVLALVASLPPGEAVRRRIVELVWPAATDESALTDRQLDGRLRTAFSQLKAVWRAYLREDEVERLWRAQGGVIWLDEKLVSVDLHAFLAAASAGDRAWRPPRGEPPQPSEAIAHYRRALALYSGPVLAGREQAYTWVPELQERAARRQREVSHRLAVLLQDNGQDAEAAGLWADLMRDPGPPDSERDQGDQYAYREACARAAFACCRRLRDRGRLVRVHRELRAALAALDADAEAAEPAQLAPATVELYEAIYAELTTATEAASGED